MLKKHQKTPKENRSKKEINAIYKQNPLFFSFGFFRILAPVTVAFLVYVGVILGTIHFVNNLIQTIVHVNLEQLKKKSFCH